MALLVRTEVSSEVSCLLSLEASSGLDVSWGLLMERGHIIDLVQISGLESLTSGTPGRGGLLRSVSRCEAVRGRMTYIFRDLGNNPLKEEN